jgi:hypothetical protein
VKSLFCFFFWEKFPDLNKCHAHESKVRRRWNDKSLSICLMAKEFRCWYVKMNQCQMAVASGSKNLGQVVDSYELEEIWLAFKKNC